jgi:hypothetical protein
MGQKGEYLMRKEGDIMLREANITKATAFPKTTNVDISLQ